MKLFVSVALFATSFPVIATTASAAQGNAQERRVCTQVAAARAGSRMAPRRICKTAAQWQEALGADWRQRLTGRNYQDDMEALQARTTAVDSAGLGQQGVPITHPGRGGPGPN